MKNTNQLKENAQSLSATLPAPQAEILTQLLEALSESEQQCAILAEAIRFVASPLQWVQRDDDIWEWRRTPRGDFMQVLNSALAQTEIKP